MKIISNSGLLKFQRCPKLYTYHYHDRRVPPPTDAMRIGTFVHDAIQHGWRCGKDVSCHAANWAIDNAAQLDPVDAFKVAAMLEHYNPPSDRYSLIDTEVEFEMPVVNPATKRAMLYYRIMGFADLLLRDNETGATVVHEIKTTTAEIIGFGDYWSRLAVDSQVGIYSAAFGASKVIYDVLRKPQLRPSNVDKAAAVQRLQDANKNDQLEPTRDDVLEQYGRRVSARIAELPEEWHQWRELPIDDHRRKSSDRDIFDGVRNLRAAYQADSFPRHSGACRSVFGTCKYLDVCCGRARLDDDFLFEDKTNR